jgi:hypothetical protein
MAPGYVPWTALRLRRRTVAPNGRATGAVRATGRAAGANGMRGAGETAFEWQRRKRLCRPDRRRCSSRGLELALQSLPVCLLSPGSRQSSGAA